ncbi:hypothetical protein ACFL0I_04105 [Gemmatimonadota bacterium]
MASEMLERDDLSVYVLAGVPRSFKKKLSKFVEGEAKEEGEIMLLDGEITEWVARLQGDKRRSHEKTPASAALWRAYRALSAARYHLQDEDMEGRIRRLRREVEEVWEMASPLHDLNGQENEEGEEGEG